MNEIGTNNFKTKYPMIEESIKAASFISIDAEFTGLQTSEHFNNSLFDSIDVRYVNIKKNIQPFIIIQCGITTFQHVSDENCYSAKCYNFHLIPRSIPFKNRQFSWQMTALEFLSAHNFNFNTFVCNGIPYLDEIDEALLRKQLEGGNIIRNIEHLSYKEEEIFRECKKKVQQWISGCPHQISLTLHISSPILQYMVQKELRDSFRNIWTSASYKHVSVIRVSPDMRNLLEKDEDVSIETELLENCIGFSKVFKLLTSLKKPILGHNVLLDLMFMHQQFYRPLPSDYNQFKSNIHALFPEIYDTKFLSFEVKKQLSNEGNWKINSLGCIYEYFENRKINVAYNSPRIKLSGKSLDTKSYHNAGWDSYFAGYIFIKLGFLLCLNKYGEGLNQRSITHTELMSGVKHSVNCINITRSSEVYSKLDGNDPLSTRPEWLHVKLKSSNINVKEKFLCLDS
ncbi:pre-piRNA 3'-exonuclease trimmer isoform X2 [Ptiloglossa arizonensis]|uniref:pre-piRNA 3'-exonuclease trimmer isoform X2 n=1 Tax=Ptiloglossa arizonensis TaxID=3350558 RepID=UPI003FA132F5